MTATCHPGDGYDDVDDRIRGYNAYVRARGDVPDFLDNRTESPAFRRGWALAFRLYANRGAIA
jgi:hypothetical protein